MKLKPENNSSLNGIRTHDLCDADVLLYQLSCRANWELITLYDLSYIHRLVFFTIYWYITNPQCDQLPVGLIAQLVQQCTGIAEVMGSQVLVISTFSLFPFLLPYVNRRTIHSGSQMMPRFSLVQSSCTCKV